MSAEVVFTFVCRVVMLLSGLASSVVVAKCLGTEGQGVFFVVITFASMASQFANLGLHASNTYLLAKDHSLQGAVVGNSLWISLVVGGGGGLLAAAVCQWLRWPTGIPPVYLWMGAGLVAPKVFFMLAGNILVGLNRFRAFNLSQVLSYVAILLLTLLTWLFGGGIGEFLAANLIGWYGVAIVFFVLFFRKEKQAFRFQKDVFQAAISYSAKVYLVCLLGFLVLRLNVFMLQDARPEREVGHYSIAVQITEVLILLPASLSLVLFPKLVRDTENRKEMTTRALIVVGAATALECLLSLVLAEPILRMVFREEYVPAAAILYWMLPGVFFCGMISVLSQYLAAIGFPRLMVGIWSLALLLTLVCGYWLIRRDGGVGAAITLSTVYATVFFLQLALIWFGAAEHVVSRPTSQLVSESLG